MGELKDMIDEMSCLFDMVFRSSNYNPTPAMGYDGVDEVTENYLREKLGKLEPTDQTPWLFHHSDMLNPSTETFEKSYKEAIMGEKGLKQFGKCQLQLKIDTLFGISAITFITTRIKTMVSTQPTE